MKRAALLFLAICGLFCLALAHIDRHFFKKNKSFSIQMILSTLPAQSEWETAPITSEQRELFLDIFSQKFRYLDRGGQSAVFISDSGDYVLKFYRFPSHMRPLGWLKHPLAYHFTKKRAEIKEYNFEKLNLTFQSFLLAYDSLKEESGLTYVHLNPTNDLNFSVTLVDRLKNHYLVDLDRVTFVLQKRVDRVFPTLTALLEKGEIEKLKAHLQSLIDLVITQSEKGIADNDAILEQNYGFSEGRAVLVDVGRLARDPSIKDPAVLRAHTEIFFGILHNWLNDRSPELCSYFDERLEETLSTRS